MDDDVYLVDMPVYGGENDASTSNNEFDERPQRLPVVPPPRSNDDLMLDVDEEDANAPALAEIEDVPMAAAKKSRSTIRNLGKMDTTRLLGPRGFPVLESYFKGVEFKGKGHELENLNLLMSKLEHWAHNMCPKLRFEDTLDKIETLAHKREVKTYMKKYRMGFDDDDGRQVVVASDNNSASDADRQLPTPHQMPTFVDLYASPTPGNEAVAAATSSYDNDNNDGIDDVDEEALPTLSADDADREQTVVLEDTDGRDGSVPSGFIPFNQAPIE